MNATDLSMDPKDVARLTRTQREDRVRRLVWDSRDIVERDIDKHRDGHRIAAVSVLYSGGNDSTTLAHIFRTRADLAIHINTGIGIRQTRDFVRTTCADWALTLMVKSPPPGCTFREMVLAHGFPGPGQHFKMYQRLKERGLRLARKELVSDPRKERVVFLAGRRRSESTRRNSVPESEREGSTIWVSPLIHWTKPDLNTYRLMQGDVPVNEVSDLIHMSGECLCGSFAEKFELDMIGQWFPEVLAEIRELEALIADREDIPAERRKWGWGAYRERSAKAETLPKSGPLCTSCDARAHGGEVLAAVINGGAS